jgi:ABC-type dipeptide/oligopeptide/nickel transport system permease subunit
MTRTAVTVPAEQPVAVPETAPVARGRLTDFWRRFRRDRVALVAACFIAVVVLGATAGAPLAAWATGHPPDEQYVNGLTIDGIPLPPFSHEVGADGIHQDPHGQFFVLGTDKLGRDVLVRLLYGARISLLVAFAATGAALLIGIALGLLAGYFRGVGDTIISRGIETAMAFPALLLAVGLAAVIGPGLPNVILVITLFSWYYPARLVRSSVLSLRESQFVEAAHMMGASHSRVMFRHLLPQLTGPLIVYATGVVAANILFEAGLSYLGLGVPPPTPSWGQMLADGVSNGLYRVQPWLALVPGLALAGLMLALQLLGDGLRDALATKGASR